MAREREVSQLCSICDGLYNIPTYTSDVGTPQGAKEIASVVAHLESTVLLPLEELGLRMHMRLESLQEAWAIQHDLGKRMSLAVVCIVFNIYRDTNLCVVVVCDNK